MIFFSDFSGMKTPVTIPNQTITKISKAILFIENNLQQELTLMEVAKEAHFSPFHFHRLFSIVTGETLNNFIIRKRIEKAASFLIHKKEIPITVVAEKVGFTSLSSFSRTFKKFYNKSPLEFKKESAYKFSKICKTESKNGQVITSFEQYICIINNSLNWLKMNASIEVKTIPELQLAYISHQGDVNLIEDTYARLIKWAFPKGLMGQENLRMVTIYHDSFKITEPSKIRMSACMTLNTLVKTEGEVNLRTQPKTKCIVSRFEIIPAAFQKAWENSFVWMSEHGYEKGGQDPFGIYYNNPEEHPEGKCIVDICIPIT